MSRIGNKHIEIPAGVTVAIEEKAVKVTGPKGTLEVALNEGISAKLEDNILSFSRANEQKQTKQNHGTTRANVHNAIIGVTQGFKKSLEMRGIGFKASVSGDVITLWAGYSHTVDIKAEPGVKLTVTDQVKIDVEGIDKQKVGQTAALIRDVRRPEPYLGKGIRYVGEYVATKEGKRASK